MQENEAMRQAFDACSGCFSEAIQEVNGSLNARFEEGFSEAGQEVEHLANCRRM